MTTKTVKTALFASLIAVMLIPAVMDDAFAFQATEDEKKIIQSYANVSKHIEKKCSDDTQRHKSCDKLEERLANYTVQLNEKGIFLDGQSPDLAHLSSQFDSTRAAAQAGVTPVDNTSVALSGACSTCDDDEDEKTMYVKSAYKDPYVLWGYTFWDHYAGVDSADISSGTTSSQFTPQWNGLNQGIVPYCYTSSVSLPTTASYGIGMTMSDNNGYSLIWPSTTNQNSNFVWYDTNDKFEYATQNNVVSGPLIVCTISSVSLS